jgi:hypothetical protein
MYTSGFDPVEPSTDIYKNVYHRKVLTEKVIKNHRPSDDELEWLTQHYSSFFLSTSNLGYVTWANYDFAKYDTIEYIQETKPHLEIPEPVRKAVTKNPPVLTKKFGHYSSMDKRNLNIRHNNRQFSRKAF